LLAGAKKDLTVSEKDGKTSRKVGQIISIDPTENTAVVRGLNVCKVHKRPQGDDKKGTIESVEKPIRLSKLAYYDAKTGKIVKIGFSVVNNKKVRINKATKAPLDSK
jgi:large subunit ribosomal protein L24